MKRSIGTIQSERIYHFEDSARCTIHEVDTINVNVFHSVKSHSCFCPLTEYCHSAISRSCHCDGADIEDVKGRFQNVISRF